MSDIAEVLKKNRDLIRRADEHLAQALEKDNTEAILHRLVRETRDGRQTIDADTLDGLHADEIIKRGRMGGGGYPAPTFRVKSIIGSEGTLLEGFETLGDWTVGGTGATLEADTAHFMGGLQSLKVNGINGAGAYGTKTISIDLSAVTNFILWVYLHNPLANLTSIAIYISSTTNFSKYFLATIPASGQFKTGWNRVVLAKSQFTNSGADDWANLMIRLRVRVNPAASSDASVSFDDLRHTHIARAKCLICFDDCWESPIIKAKPILDGNGQKASDFVITGKVGTTNYLTLTQLRTLHDAGWALCNHTKDHLDLTLQTPADIEIQVNDAYNWLVNNGFGDSAIFFSYPNGAYDDTVLSVVKGKHKLARSILSGSYQPNISTLGYDIEYLLKIMSVINTTAVADVTARIDLAIIQKGLLILVFHQIVDSGASVETQYLTADFQSISNYLKTKVADIDVITFSDLMVQVI